MSCPFTNATNWLESRTGVVGLLNWISGWSVPAGVCGCRYLPAMIVFAAVLQGFTGVMLWAHYSPAVNTAWESVFYVQYVLPGGWLVRGIHHYSAQLLVALLGLYIAARIFTGRYRAPREFVFWTALVMLLISLGACLTGDLLQWTLSGYSATLVRVRFLQMIPVIGDSLFKLVAGGSQFGSLTIPRFLVLHILMAYGIFGLAVLWRVFDYRASLLAAKQTGCETVPFWSCHVVRVSLACIATMLIVLGMVFHKPLINYHADFSPPRGAYCGVPVGAPADITMFDDAARPEWSFRALYQLSNQEIFPGPLKWIPIFIIPSSVVTLLFLMPFIGTLRIGHIFNVAAMFFLITAFGYLTYSSYHHDYADESMASFREAEAATLSRGARAVELALSPAGIPPQGILARLKTDPLAQGPLLFKKHCLSCHAFEPLAGETTHADFPPMICSERSAPNLYQPLRREWIRGFIDPDRAKSDDYFGKTKFARGTMVTTYLDSSLSEILQDEPVERLDDIAEILLGEAQHTTIPADGSHLTQEQQDAFVDFSCLDCHRFYNTRKEPPISAPDLRGYMSREWMIGFIADPTAKRFYGPDSGRGGNDRMPAYHQSNTDCLMTQEEIATLVDWLRRVW